MMRAYYNCYVHVEEVFKMHWEKERDNSATFAGLDAGDMFVVTYVCR
jgi:hypothetical protein